MFVSASIASSGNIQTMNDQPDIRLSLPLSNSAYPRFILIAISPCQSDFHRGNVDFRAKFHGISGAPRINLLTSVYDRLDDDFNLTNHSGRKAHHDQLATGAVLLIL